MSEDRRETGSRHPGGMRRLGGIGGFVSGKLIVFALLGFGLYSAYCFLPVFTTQSQFEHLIAAILEGAGHNLPDRAVRDKTLRAARAESMPLTENDIVITREKSHGERIIHVEMHFPVTVSYLGSERILHRTLHVSQSYKVDEAALAQRVAQEEERRRTQERKQRASEAQAADYYGQIKEKCAEGTSADFVVTHVMVTMSDGSFQTVACDTAHRIAQQLENR